MDVVVADVDVSLPLPLPGNAPVGAASDIVADGTVRAILSVATAVNVAAEVKVMPSNAVTVIDARAESTDAAEKFAGRENPAFCAHVSTSSACRKMLEHAGQAQVSELTSRQQYPATGAQYVPLSQYPLSSQHV